MPKPKHTYELLDSIEVPEDVPEAGIKAGMTGAVVDIMHDGVLTVEVPAPDYSGRTLDLVDIDPEPEPRVVGRWRLGESRTS